MGLPEGSVSIVAVAGVHVHGRLVGFRERDRGRRRDRGREVPGETVGSGDAREHDVHGRDAAIEELDGFAGGIGLDRRGREHRRVGRVGGGGAVEGGDLDADRGLESAWLEVRMTAGSGPLTGETRT
jgi:hypothetical protein